ncbi:MAG: tetratricopeptide repeat protein [Mariprofundus sp.]
MTSTTQDKALPDEFHSGLSDYDLGNYEEALHYFTLAADKNPTSGKIKYYLGLTRQGMLDYTKAEQAFSEAVRLNPSLGGAWAHLAEMFYRRGAHPEAGHALDKAAANHAREAYTAYIKGLVLMELGSYAEAITSLQQSQHMNPAFQQKATYAIAMVYSKQDNKHAAESAFKEAIAMDPKSAVGVYASFGLQFLHRPQKRLWHADIGYSVQYDDNVILNPGGTITSLLPSGQKDFTHILSLHAGYKPEMDGPFAIRTDATYYKSLHQQLSYMDVDAIGLSVTHSYTGKAGVFSLETRGDHFSVGRKHYMWNLAANPSFSIAFNNKHHGILNGSYQRKLFANQSLLPAAENRNAYNLALGYMHYIYTSNQQGYSGLGYTFDNDATAGVNWAYTGHRISAAAQLPLANKTGFRFNGDYYMQRYKNIHSVYGVIRRDNTLTLSPMLTYDLMKTTLHLQYTYMQASSNIRLYQYSRNIIDAGFEYNY